MVLLPGVPHLGPLLQPVRQRRVVAAERLGRGVAGDDAQHAQQPRLALAREAVGDGGRRAVRHDILRLVGVSVLQAPSWRSQWVRGQCKYFSDRPRMQGPVG